MTNTAQTVRYDGRYRGISSDKHGRERLDNMQNRRRNRPTRVQSGQPAVVAVGRKCIWEIPDQAARADETPWNRSQNSNVFTSFV
jgi:hypothetical protein